MDCYQLIKAGIGWGYNFEAILNFEAMLNFEAKLNIEPMLNIKAMLNIETMLIVEAMLNFEAMSTGTSEKTHLLMSHGDIHCILGVGMVTPSISSFC